MTPNPVRWFEIYVQDMQRSRTFYETVLGTRLEKPDSGELEMWAFPQAMGGPGSAGAIVKAQGVPSGGNSTLVYFACDDVATEAGRVVAAGGKLVRDKMSIGQYGFIALAHDTEGNMFGMHSLR